MSYRRASWRAAKREALEQASWTRDQAIASQLWVKESEQVRTLASPKVDEIKLAERPSSFII